MRSLAVKLTLAFLIVGITGALLVAFFVGQRTQREFDRFLVDRFQNDLAAELIDYYESNGGWRGAAAVLHRRHMMGSDQPPVTLLDKDRRVIFSRRYEAGEQLSPEQADVGLAVTAEGQTLGWLLLDLPEPRRMANAEPESFFLRRVRQATLFGALGAGLVALLLGGVLARTLTQPLRSATPPCRGGRAAVPLRACAARPDRR